MLLGCALSQVLREHYLRDDIYCGALNCNVCDSKVARLSESASTILVLDTNVVLTQVGLVLFVITSQFFISPFLPLYFFFQKRKKNCDLCVSNHVLIMI